MGEHKLPKPRITPDHESHIRESRLPSARRYEAGPTDCEGMRMWAARYSEDVSALLNEVDRLRALTRLVDPEDGPR